MNDPGRDPCVLSARATIPGMVARNRASGAGAPRLEASIRAAPASGPRLSAGHRRCERMPDADLVQATLEGDQHAARAIVTRYVPLVRRCLGSSFAGADLDDHVQEVFAGCFASLSRLRNPEALRSYLIGIALRRGASERRRCKLRGWETLTASGEVPERSEMPEVPIEVRQVAWQMRTLLGKLKPESSRLLELRFVEEHELTEVAHSVGVSLATAKRQLASALLRARALVQADPALVEYGCEARRRMHARERAHARRKRLPRSRSCRSDLAPTDAPPAGYRR
jgi:RNA polymerase sigma-70 factor (ECF subfamily)